MCPWPYASRVESSRPNATGDNTSCVSTNIILQVLLRERDSYAVKCSFGVNTAVALELSKSDHSENASWFSFSTQLHLAKQGTL